MIVKGVREEQTTHHKLFEEARLAHRNPATAIHGDARSNTNSGIPSHVESIDKETASHAAKNRLTVNQT